jgi:UDP-N-acetylmuramoyl-tripeptide--D-alanyl-D-alanine ligase
MNIELYVEIAAVVFLSFWAIERSRFELQMAQQNSYRLARYWKWLRSDCFSTERVTSLLMMTVVIIFIGRRWEMWAVGMIGAIALYKGIKLLRIKYKKPLVFTSRALRLHSVGIAVVLLGVSLVWYLTGNVAWGAFTAAALACFSPIVLSLSLILLMPVEWITNRWYYNDARRILRGMKGLTVIGITGSYGKTSTKHYLYRILAEKYNVLMTPGSFNTTLGVVRTVRERLKPFHDVFIVEMGAKQRDDIAEICRLVNPSIGIITAVGEQHLESFKSIENVQRTKFELIDALPSDGVAILNNDFPYIANRAVTNVDKVFRYTSGTGEADYRIADVAYGRGESSFAIESAEGKTEPMTTRLVGIHNLSNILAGYIAGKTLGMTDGEMRYAISQIEQVEHRLSIKQAAGGVTVIDDAFNSNPHGAAMALDVLASFTDGRRVVVTPGMIELGAKQAQYNLEFGAKMASSCDYAIVVGAYNREAILAGLTDGGFEEKSIYTARDFAAASAHLAEVVRAGDVVLYENDLPDTFK